MRGDEIDMTGGTVSIKLFEPFDARVCARTGRTTELDVVRPQWLHILFPYRRCQSWCHCRLSVARGIRLVECQNVSCRRHICQHFRRKRRSCVAAPKLRHKLQRTKPCRIARLRAVIVRPRRRVPRHQRTLIPERMNIIHSNQSPLATHCNNMLEKRSKNDQQQHLNFLRPTNRKETLERENEKNEGSRPTLSCAQ